MSRQATIGALKDTCEHIDALMARKRDLNKQRREIIILLHDEYGMSFQQIANETRFGKDYMSAIYHNWNGAYQVISE